MCCGRSFAHTEGADIEALVAGAAGTNITPEATGVTTGATSTPPKEN
jgi:hypothetical protein